MGNSVGPKNIKDILRAISNNDRLKILCMLRNGEIQVFGINKQLDLSQAQLSQHLKKLRLLKVVKSRKAGKEVYYSLYSFKIRGLVDAMCSHLMGMYPDEKASKNN